jgi:hypothetical protein
VRIGPDQDLTEVTAAEIRDLIARLVTAGTWQPGDAPVLLVMDAGYDVVPVVVPVGRSTGDAGGPHPQRPGHARPGATASPSGVAAGRDMRHASSWPFPRAGPKVQAERAEEAHPRYGRVRVRAWGGLHPELERRAEWADHAGPLLIIEGSIISIWLGHPPQTARSTPLRPTTSSVRVSWDQMS